MRTIRAAAVTVGVTATMVVTSCIPVTPADEIPAIDMSRAQVWETVGRNLHTVAPDYEPPDLSNPNLVQQSGCATSSSSMMPTGPPWRYADSTWADDPPEKFLADIDHGFDELEKRGFTVGPPPRPDDSRDRYAEDGQGFVVSSRFEKWRDGRLRVDLRSTSPCVRHPGEDGG